MKAPTLFIGHGSPLNAIESNAFTQKLNHLGKSIPKPQAILCISAHWLTHGTFVTHMSAPRTIHDFYGFPEALFQVQYPAPGFPKLAEEMRELIQDPKIQLDETWGFDHGTWSVLKHLYPDAAIPVLQLSIDQTKPPLFHYELGKKLNALREQGVLILGSGNIVHNLRKIRWESEAKPFIESQVFDEWVKAQLFARNDLNLIENFLKVPGGNFSVPSLDHYLPLLYVLGASDKNETLEFVYEGIELGSISMRSFQFS